MSRPQRDELPKYVVIDGSGSERFVSTHRQTVVMMTNNKADLDQGDWFIDGIPAGGFTVHPCGWLNETERQEAELKELKKRLQ